MRCEEIKPITAFSYGFGSYRKADKCDECKTGKLKQWSFGGSIRALSKDARICKSSTYFDKTTPSLSKIKDQARMINDRDYVETKTND